MRMLSPPLPIVSGGIGVTTMVPVGAGGGRLTMRGAVIIPVIGVATIPAIGVLIGDIITATIPDGAEAIGQTIIPIQTVVLTERYARVEVRGLPEVRISVVRTLIPHAHKEQP